MAASAGAPSSTPPARSEQSANSDRPNRPGTQHSPKVSGVRPRAAQGIKLDSKLRLFPEIPLAHSSPLAELRLFPPPLREKDGFGFFRRCFGSFRRRKPKREGGRRRGGSREGIRGPGGVPDPHLALQVGEWRKRKAELVEGLRRWRETKAADEVTGARGCCGGWQRGFVRLRRVDALGRETGSCACVEVGLRRGLSGLREGDGPPQNPQCACARLSLPPAKVPNS